jgi:hypothetical protein
MPIYLIWSFIFSIGTNIEKKLVIYYYKQNY